MSIQGRLFFCLRLAVCYLAGFGGGSVIVSAIAMIVEDRGTLEWTAPIEALIDTVKSIAFIGSFGVVLTWPLFLVAVAAAFVFARSVATHPAIWSGAAFRSFASTPLRFFPSAGIPSSCRLLAPHVPRCPPCAFTSGASGGR
jgi:hypothetical protein